MLTFRSIASSSKGNVNLITDGLATIMLDCGLPWRKVREAMGFNTSSLSGILVSHSHNDHCKGVKDAAAAGIDVYLLKETREEKGFASHRFHDVEPGKTFAVGSFLVAGFSLVHDVPCCGFLLSGGGEKAAYITDTAYVPNRLPALNLLAIECNFCEDTLDENVSSGAVHSAMRHRLVNAHFGLPQVIDFLRANDLSRLREIHLLHLSDGNSNELQMQVAIENAVPPGVRVVVADE